MNYAKNLPELSDMTPDGDLYRCPDGEIMAGYHRHTTELLVGAYGLRSLLKEKELPLHPISETISSVVDMIDRGEYKLDGFSPYASVDRDGARTEFLYDDRYQLLVTRSSEVTRHLGRFTTVSTLTSHSLSMVFSHEMGGALLNVASEDEIEATVAASMYASPETHHDRRRIASRIQPLNISRRSLAQLSKSLGGCANFHHHNSSLPKIQTEL